MTNYHITENENTVETMANILNSENNTLADTENERGYTTMERYTVTVEDALHTETVGASTLTKAVEYIKKKSYYYGRPAVVDLINTAEDRIVATYLATATSIKLLTKAEECGIIR